MDNCDSFITNSYDEFIEEMKNILEIMSKVKIIMVMSDVT